MASTLAASTSSSSSTGTRTELPYAKGSNGEQATYDADTADASAHNAYTSTASAPSTNYLAASSGPVPLRSSSLRSVSDISPISGHAGQSGETPNIPALRGEDANGDIKAYGTGQSGTGIGTGNLHLSSPDRPPHPRSNSTSHLPVPASSSSSVPFPSSSSTSNLPQLSLAIPTTSQTKHNSLALSTSSRSSSNPDALHIQKTYQRISAIGGIPRDGFVEGVELTRERRTEASISGYLSPLTASTSTGMSLSMRPDVQRQQSAKAFSNLLQADDGLDVLSAKRSSAIKGNGTNGTARKTSFASNKTLDEEKEELRLLEKVDRYGFFAPTYSQHARLVLLARKDCLELPSDSLLKEAFASPSKKASTSGNKKRGTRRSLTGSSGDLPNPYLPVHSAQGSRDSSRRSSMQPLATNGSTSTTSLPSHGSTSNQNGAPGGGPENVSRSSSYTLKENTRADKWYNEMLLPNERDGGGNIVSWKLSPSEEMGGKVGRRVMKGIPDRWRAAAWEALISRRRKLEKGKGREIEDTALRRRFFDLILEPCDQDVQIDLDVPRTISGHLYFHTRYGLGQRSLFSVLHAFALLCPECGYCQGMGSLAATFLCYLPPERAYAAMVRLHDTYDLHTIFAPGFPGMMECFYVQERLVEVLMPDVHEMFEKNYITISSFATKWYITLFANGISFSTQLRIWDAFLLEGKDVLILVSTAIIWALRRHFASPKADFESILSILSSFFVPEDEDALLRWVAKMLKKREVRARMNEWKEEYQRTQV